MRVRTYLGLLLGLLVVVAAGILAQLNRELLQTPFQITADTKIPFYALLIGVFLTAFLPTATLLLVQSVRRDLEVRSARRKAREAESLDRALHRGIDALTDGQWQRALDELAPVYSARPEDFTILLHYGSALRHGGRPQEALDLHQQAAVLFPHSVTLLHQIARDHEALGQDEVAQEIRNRIAREFPEVSLRVLQRRRDKALAQERWEEAGQLHRRILELSPKEEAGSEEAQAITRGLEYQEGMGLLEDDRPAEARQAFAHLLRQEPGFVPAHIMLGEADLLLGDEDSAIGVWLDGYAATGDPVFLQRLEDHFIEQVAPPRAIETLGNLISRSDNDLLPRFFLGRLYYRLEMHQEALKLLDSIADRVAPSPTFHFLRARIYEKTGRPADAIKAYHTAAQEAGIPSREYACSACQAKYDAWSSHCRQCGAWGSISLDFREEKVDPEALGVRPAPVWGPPADRLAAETPEAPVEGDAGDVS